MSIRVAAIDCGTNSIRLLVADVDVESGLLVDLDRRMEIVRLGQGVDSTGRLAPEALERTFAACDRYAAVIAGLGVERIRFVATSASRDAENRADFVAGVLARIRHLRADLPPTAKRIASYIETHAADVIRMSITELADQSEASEGSCLW